MCYIKQITIREEFMMTNVLIKNHCDDFAIAKDDSNTKDCIELPKFERMIAKPKFRKVYADGDTDIYVNIDALEEIEALPMTAKPITAGWMTLQNERQYALIKINKKVSFFIKPDTLDSCLKSLMEMQVEKFPDTIENPVMTE